MGVLYLCSTPLGNLKDITRRVLDVLGGVDLIAAEDTRQTRKLLNHYGIKAKTTSYHEHNEREKAPYLLAELAQGKEIALVSDAGTPAISDPGFFLIQQAPVKPGTHSFNNSSKLTLRASPSTRRILS